MPIAEHHPIDVRANSRRLGFVAAAAVLALGAGLDAAPGASAQDAPAPVTINPAPPVVVLSYYESEDLPKLVRAVRKAGIPAGTPVYFGTYAGGGDPTGLLRRPTNVLKGPPGGLRAPIFPLQPSAFWIKRQVSQRDARRAGRSYAGRIPSTGRLLAGPASRRIAWGRELGRRFRDRLRVLRRLGLPDRHLAVRRDLPERLRAPRPEGARAHARRARGPLSRAAEARRPPPAGPRVHGPGRLPAHQRPAHPRARGLLEHGRPRRPAADRRGVRPVQRRPRPGGGALR